MGAHGGGDASGSVRGLVLCVSGWNLTVSRLTRDKSRVVVCEAPVLVPVSTFSTASVMLDDAQLL